MFDEKLNKLENNSNAMKIGKTEYIIHIRYSGKMNISEKIKELILREIDNEVVFKKQY